jgi:MFS family permease
MEHPTQSAAMQNLFKNRNFLLLSIGQALSLIGDQFHFIAAPWLVLQITNDPLALGTVMALGGVPRAVFMLFGGAVTDRFSPRTIMLISDSLRLFLTAFMCYMTLTGAIQLWMIYVLTLLFGIISGFFAPASGAILPQLIKKDELQAGNSITQGAGQLVNFFGPVLAGGVIAWFSHRVIANFVPEMTGIGFAFGVDSASFLVSAITLWFIRYQISRPGKDQQVGDQKSVFASIAEGIRYMWNDPMLRMVYILILVLNFLVVGPLVVGAPVLVRMRMAGDAAAYGLIMSGYGGGNLAGLLLAGMLPRPKTAKLATVLSIVVVALFGVGMAALAPVTNAWAGFAIMLVMGVGNGWISILLITSLQRRTPSEMLGRVMSMIFLANVGLVPVSQALSGVILKYNLSALFIGAGVLILVSCVWAALNPDSLLMGKEMSMESTTAE